MQFFLNFRINPNLRIPVYCSAIRQGAKADFDFLWEHFKSTNVAHEQIVILQALGCSKDKTLLYVRLKKKLHNFYNFNFSRTFWTK